MRRLRRPRVAVLVDDIFQAVGLDRAEAYTKILLNLIEYPPGDYEKVVVIVSSSEGVTRARIGRHLWTVMYLLWNMSKEGFRELYEALPDPKPPFEDVWAVTGGNPRILEMLHSFSWSTDAVTELLIEEKRLVSTVAQLSSDELEVLERALSDPDAIIASLRDPAGQGIERLLTELNLIVEIWDRDSRFWMDVPPPEKDPRLGIGRFYAWQTPLHREAVRRALTGHSRQQR